MDTQRGFTLIEVLAALAIGAAMMIGLATMIDSSLEDTKGQQAALHQSQVVAAATQYITDNYDTLTAAATATTPAAPITIAMLKSGGYLSSSFADTNAYGQTPCVLVMQPTTNKLDALVVTEGGREIPASSIGYVAANAGQGGGYIPSTVSGSSPPLVVKGAFGSASVDNATLTNYLKQKCTSTAASAGHLASTLFYGGPGRLTTDFVYRDAVPGHPELNRMTTPLHITLAADAVENTSDSSCSTSDTSTWSGVVVNSSGAILSCQSGVWRRQEARYWRDPKPDYASLISLPASGNTVGDVRMIEDKGHAFMWNGSAWVPLSVDQNNNLTVSTLTTDEMQLNTVVTAGTACSPNGLVARDSSGMIMSCQNLTWQTQAQIELGSNDTGCERIRTSKYWIAEDEANCPTVFPKSSIVYYSGYDTYTATITRTVTASKNGLISVNAWSQMNRGLVSDPNNAEGQVSLTVSILDSSNTVLASSQAQSPKLSNDSAGINVTLSKAVPETSKAYQIQIVTAYSLFDGGTKTYDQSNYTLYGGGTVQQTPLMTGWNIDLFY